MAKKKIKVVFVRTEYCDFGDGTWSSDMGESISESIEPIEELNNTRAWLEEYINSDDSLDETARNEDDTFAVYEVYTAIAETDIDGEGNYGGGFDEDDIVSGSDRLTDVYVCASEEMVRETIQEWFSDSDMSKVKFHFRTRFDLFTME